MPHLPQLCLDPVHRHLIRFEKNSTKPVEEYHEGAVLIKTAVQLRGILKTLGPGILYAGAAIGASHLVQSTRAGASYGFKLIWIVLLINLFKYPFFEFAYRYTAATGDHMLVGYRKLGRWVIITFFCLMIGTGIVNVAAITIVTSGLTSLFFNIQMDQFLLSSILLGIILSLLFIGRYALLDRVMKVMIAILSLLTIITLILAIQNHTPVPSGFTPPPVWDNVGIAFLIALMGWMPTPIEASVFPSLWALERNKQTRYQPKFREYLVDFHVGYIGSAVMAVIFLSLGAVVMFGSGMAFSESTVPFSKQIVSVYAKTLGMWSFPVIAAIAMLTMFSTALTVIDAYPRTLEAALQQIFPGVNQGHRRLYWVWVAGLSVIAILIIGFFSSSMKRLLDFATIVSFLAAPVFAFLNYRVVTGRFMPAGSLPGKWLRLLGVIGILFLSGFSLLFLFSKIFL